MRHLLSVTFVLLQLSVPAAALAGSSKCDSDITKAMVKKVTCDSKLYADAQKSQGSVDQDKLHKCDQDFLDKCTKIKQKDPAGCVVHTQECSSLADDLGACIGAIGG